MAVGAKILFGIFLHSLVAVLLVSTECRSLSDGEGFTTSDPIDRASKVYCEGRLLHAVQMSGMFNDSKDFVDMPMREDPEVVLAAFDALGDPDEFDLQEFVERYFLAAGSDIVEYIPTDWKSNPKSLDKIENPAYKEWALALNGLWKTLGRTVAPAVKKFPQRHSFVPRRYPMIVPGGRFRESYYWDSLWIIKGLLACEMQQSALDVVGNLLDDVELFGFVPNGARIYYTDRSQPPVLSEMVKVIVDYVGEESDQGRDLMRRAWPLLLREYEYWTAAGDADGGAGHSVNFQYLGRTYTASRYHSRQHSPRPESYREDVDTSRHWNGSDTTAKNNKAAFFNEIRSGAETGWDFSSRFLSFSSPESSLPRVTAENYMRLVEREREEGGRDFPLYTERAARVIPACLNSVMLRFEANMASFCRKQTTLSHSHSDSSSGGDDCEVWGDRVRSRRELLDEVLWNEALGRWSDLDLDSLQHIQRCASAQSKEGEQDDGCGSWHASASEWFPLWAFGSGEAADTAERARVIGVAVDSFVSSGLLVGKLGPLTTTIVSNQQWDAPNVWAPLVGILVDGLHSHGYSQHAKKIAEDWMKATYEAWHKTKGLMFEKYNAFNPDEMGGGGEYVPQTGFGWTNGLSLSFLLSDF